jgi:hypothetical protein
MKPEQIRGADHARIGHAVGGHGRVQAEPFERCPDLRLSGVEAHIRDTRSGQAGKLGPSGQGAEGGKVQSSLKNAAVGGDVDGVAGPIGGNSVH